MTMKPSPQRVHIVGAKAGAAANDAKPAVTDAEAAERRAALPVLIGAGAVALVLFGAAALVSSLRSAGAAAEVMVPTAQHEAELARLVAEGLPAQGVTVRDWADIDGDGVYANGVPVVVGAAPMPVGLAPGALTLNAFAGSAGCITLEVTAPGRAPYQLCLPPNTVTPAIPVR
jgi:hypothetical protein